MMAYRRGTKTMKDFIAPLTLYLRPADPDDPDTGMENTSQDDPAAVEYWRGDGMLQYLLMRYIDVTEERLETLQSEMKERNDG